MNFKNSNYCICKERSYTFSYDAGNRLTAANYAGLNNENYSLSNMGYDSNGNILSLTRNGKNGNSFSIIDNLTYSYTGNQLTNITDAISGNEDVGDLRDAGTSTDYTYYANGSLKSDANKGISNIVYDTYLNKISQVQFTNGKTMRFFYDASGQLLKRTFTGGDTWSYSGDAVYKNGVFYQTAIPEGRIVNNNGNLEKQFYYQDHLGSNRVVYRSNNGKLEVVQRNDYDIWGWELNNSICGSQPNLMKYLNRERINETGWQHLGARMFDPQNGRFLSIDPVIEGQEALTSYQYGWNNPIRYKDPEGNYPADVRPNAQALNAIKIGLTTKDAQFVKLDSRGFIDKQTINSNTSQSGNYNALKQVVNDSKVYDVQVTDKLIYKDNEGNLKTQKLDVTYTDFLTGEKLTLVEGAKGFTAIPGTTNTINSPDSEVKIVISSGLNALDQSKNVAHEVYGHGFMYSKGEDSAHRVKGMKETNIKLKEQIKNRTNETETNFKNNN